MSKQASSKPKTKEQAAKFLGVSVRTLQRYMSTHKIGFTMRRTKTGEEAMFDVAELERFKGEQNTERLTATVAPSVSRMTEPVSTDEVSEQTALAPVSVLQQLPAILQAMMDARTLTPAASVPIADKPLLTIADVHLLTGLSSQHLRDALHTGKLKGKIIGRGWKIKRPDLDDYIKKL